MNYKIQALFPLQHHFIIESLKIKKKDVSQFAITYSEALYSVFHSYLYLQRLLMSFILSSGLLSKCSNITSIPSELMYFFNIKYIDSATIIPNRLLIFYGLTVGACLDIPIFTKETSL